MKCVFQFGIYMKGKYNAQQGLAMIVLLMNLDSITDCRILFLKNTYALWG